MKAMGPKGTRVLTLHVPAAPKTHPYEQVMKLVEKKEDFVPIPMKDIPIWVNNLMERLKYMKTGNDWSLVLFEEIGYRLHLNWTKPTEPFYMHEFTQRIIPYPKDISTMPANLSTRYFIKMFNRLVAHKKMQVLAREARLELDLIY